MKRFIVIILYLLNVLLLYTQNTSRFPIYPAGVWKMQYRGLYEEIYEYYIEADTLINSQSYYKVFKLGVAYYDTPFYYERIYVGALRDYDNKFFYVKKDDPTEVQLFDFNLELGDTIQSLIGNGIIINFIDTLPDGRKRMEYQGVCAHSCPVIQIIEGIGHAGGIMEDPPESHIGFAGHNLICYFENEESVYHNNFGFTDTRCEQNTQIQSDCNINREIKIFPLPVKNRITIQHIDQPIDIAYIEIYNIQGGKMISKRIDNLGGINKFILELPTLKAGIYLIKIFNEMTSYTQKFIVE